MRTDDFIAWALSPERTLEERFGAQKVMEWGMELYRAQRKMPPRYSWEQQAEMHKARRLNPAYEPVLKAEELRRAFEGLSVRKDWHSFGYQDRPMRDLKWLRFFPHFEEVNLSECEIEDYSPLTALPRLRKLSVRDEQTRDLRPVGGCALLEELSVWVRQPWVKVNGLERLERLHTVAWSGSPLILEAIPRWPAVRRARLVEWCVNFPLRDARQLPEMPLVEMLEVESLFSLEGMERYPRLKNLSVKGFFRDVEPLAACQELTHLTLEMPLQAQFDQLRDVSPLAKLPQLRVLEVRGQRPRDYSPLAEAPRLHEVKLMETAYRPLEGAERSLAGLFLEPWDAEFLTAEPRPLAPLKVVYFEDAQEVPEPPRLLPPDWEDNDGFRRSEGQWLKARLGARLQKLLDDEDWGDVSFSYYPCTQRRKIDVRLKSQEAAEQLRKVMETLRSELARLRCYWEVLLMVGLELPPVNDPKEMAEIERLQEQAEEEERERERKEEVEFMKRRHRLELLKETGGQIRPEEFAAPDTATPTADEEGGTARDGLRELWEAVEPDRPHPLGEQYGCVGTVREDGAFYSEQFRETVGYLLGGEFPR